MAVFLAGVWAGLGFTEVSVWSVLAWAGVVAWGLFTLVWVVTWVLVLGARWYFRSTLADAVTWFDNGPDDTDDQPMPVAGLDDDRFVDALYLFTHGRRDWRYSWGPTPTADSTGALHDLWRDTASLSEDALDVVWQTYGCARQYRMEQALSYDEAVDAARWADAHGVAALLRQMTQVRPRVSPWALAPVSPTVYPATPEQAQAYRALRAAQQELSPAAWDTAVVLVTDGMNIADAVAAARALA